MRVLQCDRRTTGWWVAAAVAVPAFVWAQTAPAPKPSPPAAATPAAQTGAKPAAPEAEPAPSEPYSYSPDGRRDPFVSLISRGAEPIIGKRSEGLAGMTTGELMLRGVLLSKGTYLALVQGTDGKTFTAHVNDRLADGTIRSIAPQGIVIMQDVNDPLSLIKQKEVRKGLRASDDAKQ